MRSTDEAYLRKPFLPPWSPFLDSWTLKKIEHAVNAHDLGLFWLSEPLGKRTLRDSSILAALNQRLSPSLGIKALVTGPDEAVVKETEAFFPAYKEGQRNDRSGVCSGKVRRRLLADMATYAVAVGQVTWTPSKDASRLDPVVTNWPLHAARYDRSTRIYYASTQDGPVPITHGDGKWILLEPYGPESHQYATLRALGIVYASAGLGRRDQAGYSAAHGNPAWGGELPPSVAVDSPEGKALQEALDVILEGRGRYVVANGTKVDLKEATGTSWQIFGEILKDTRSAAFLAYCGQDGTASNSGGSYTKALILEGVLASLVESDLSELRDGLTTGLLVPWATLNRGDPALASAVHWPLPDLEEDTRVKAIAERHKLYCQALQAHRAAGNKLTQEYADRLARSMSVEPIAIGDLPPV